MIEITDEGRQLAADLANAERSARGLKGSDWEPLDFTNTNARSPELALARLATQSLADKAALAELQASYDAAVKDLAEIDRICRLPMFEQSISMIAPIAAPYRKTDPLLIEARKLVAARYPDHAMEAIEATLRGDGDNGETVQNCLAALKRGIELSKRGEVGV